MSILNTEKNQSTTDNIIYTNIASGYFSEVGTNINNTLNVSGKMLINGLDLEERLSTIEEVLCIPPRDATMESKYPKLREIYDQYKAELEKYKTWQRLKDNK